MQKIYVFGPLYLFGECYLPVYKAVTTLCKQFADEVVCTYPDFWESKETPPSFYQRTRDVITDCDLFIAEVSNPSTGVGIELQMGVEREIPVIAIAKLDAEISSMVLGLPNLNKVVRYRGLADLLESLRLALSAWKTVAA